MSLEQSRHRRSKGGLSKAWLAAIILGSVLFVGGSVRFLKKVSQKSTAYERWRSQVVRLWDRAEDLDGFPYPTIAAILMLPTASMEPMVGAVVWQLAKGVSLVAIFFCCLRLVAGGKPLSEQGGIALLSLCVGARYISADLTHGNINLFVCLLAVGGIYAFVCRKDILSGLLLALATAVKVTPALLIIYFLYKRQWKVAVVAAVGLLLFLVVTPVLAQGPTAAWGQFGHWWDGYIRPYVVDGKVVSKQINQSLPGVLYRLTVDTEAIDHSEVRINILYLSHEQARWLIRGVSAAILVGLGFIFRRKITCRDGLAQVAQYALVLLAMLLLSERSWKAHHVTMVLGGAVIAASLWIEGFSRGQRRWLAGLLTGAIVISLVTATDVISSLANDYAEAYGAVLVANLLLVAGLLVIHGRNIKDQNLDRL